MRWASLFPRKQLFRATDTARFFVIPIVARGVVPASDQPRSSYKSDLGIRADGWLLKDAEGEVVSFNADYTQARLHWRGTIPIVARNWVEARRAVDDVVFQAFGGGVDGWISDVCLEIGRVVNFCEPNTENTWMTLVGADR